MRRGECQTLLQDGGRGAPDEVHAMECGDERLGMLGQPEVVVGEVEDEASPCVVLDHPVAVHLAVAGALLELEEAHAFVLVLEAASDLGRRRRHPVTDDQDLEVGHGLAQGTAHCRDKRGAMVVRRDDDRDERCPAAMCGRSGHDRPAIAMLPRPPRGDPVSEAPSSSLRLHTSYQQTALFASAGEVPMSRGQLNPFRSVVRSLRGR